MEGYSFCKNASVYCIWRVCLALFVHGTIEDTGFVIFFLNESVFTKELVSYKRVGSGCYYLKSNNYLQERANIKWRQRRSALTMVATPLFSHLTV